MCTAIRRAPFRSALEYIDQAPRSRREVSILAIGYRDRSRPIHTFQGEDFEAELIRCCLDISSERGAEQIGCCHRAKLEHDEIGCEGETRRRQTALLHRLT